MSETAQKAHAVSMWVNKYVERFCVGLLVVLILDVWLGVLIRYVIPIIQEVMPGFALKVTFTEELARYLMIWMALLAVSSGIAHREHIGVLFVFEKFPLHVQRWLALGFDILAFAFFALILFFGIGFVERGMSRFTMIYEIPKGYPFIGVPLAAAVACIQLALVSVRDFLAFSGHVADARAEA
jgi:TRAP-type transport system small permease protein